MAENSQHNNILLSVVGLITTIVIVGLIGFFTLDEKEDIVQGEIEVSEFRVSCKLPGRVAEIRVKEGDYVHVGDTLAIIEVPEVTSQQRAAAAAEDAAQAVSSMVSEGARKESIQMAKNSYDAAKQAADLAEATYKRIQNLYNEGVVSAQKRDEAYASYKATASTAEAAKSAYEMAKNGARNQEKLAAQKQTEVARGALDVVTSLLKETVQIATVEGEVSSIYPKEGELLGLGSPIMSIEIMSDMWGVFNVREDQLSGAKVGDKFMAYLPAFDKEVEMKVTHIKDMGTYAAWKATKTTGQYDLKTFEVKAVLTEKFEGLRPGMTMVVRWKK